LVLLQIPQPFQKPIQAPHCLFPLPFHFPATDSVFIPKILHALNQQALFSIEVLLQFVAGDVVELFQYQALGLVINKLSVDFRQ